MRESRIGQVWKHLEASCLMLILRDDTRGGIRGERLTGWACVDLETARLDWMPDSCFEATWWWRVA